MKKRWPLRLGLLAGLALFGFWFVLWLTAPEHRINEWHARQIKVGMTLDEVVGILNAKPGHQSSNPLPERRRADIRLSQAHFQAEIVMRLRTTSGDEHLLDGSRCEQWLTDHFAVLVWFDTTGKVLDTRTMTFDDGSLIFKIRSFFRLS